MFRQVTDAMNKPAIITLLNELIAVDFDAVEAYEAAAYRVENEGLRRQLQAFGEDHERHIDQLSEAVLTLGGRPAERGDIKRLLAKGKVIFGTVVGDSGIMAAMRSNEDDTHEVYERAACSKNLPPSLRQLLHHHLSDERRHCGWVEHQLEDKRPSTIPPPSYEAF